VLAAAGFRDKAAEYRLTRAGQVPLELLAASPPDLIILTSAADEYRTVLSDNLRHPVLQRLRRQHASVEVPWRLWLCGTPHVADAVAGLAAARGAIEARPPPGHAPGRPGAPPDRSGRP
jgi:iron complex transport system substrate-binding protein